MELDRRQLLTAGAAAMAGATLHSCRAVDSFVPRKVLLVDIDDVGWPFLEECLASGDAPELAALRSSAREYRNFWAAPVCSVFRAKVLTGLESFRLGNSVGANVPSNNMGPFPGPSGTWITHAMPGRRSKRGKWHLSAGPKSWPELVVEKTEERDGYDEYSGPKGNLQSYHEWSCARIVRGEPAQVIEMREFATNVTAADALADVARGIEFVHVSFNAPHAPHNLPPPANEPPGVTYPGRSRYSDIFRHLDWRLGQLVRSALANDYVVLLACDNGTSGEGKGSLAEVGVHTPLFVWGRDVEPGVSQRLVSAVDLWATVRYLRGCKDRVGTQDSLSFCSEFLRVDCAMYAERQFLRADAFPSYGIEPATATWRRAIRDERWKLVELPDAEAGEERRALYDLRGDPEERENLLRRELAPEAALALRRLSEALDQGVHSLPGNRGG